MMSIKDTLKDVEQDTLTAWEKLDMAWNSLNENMEHHGQLLQVPMKGIEAAMNHLEMVGDYLEKNRLENITKTQLELHRASVT
jgi:hypothetical protein